MPKNQTDYSKTIIYKLCCLDTDVKDIYIGHTTHFTSRKNHHKWVCLNPNSKYYNQYVYQFIREHGSWGNWKMVQIKEHHCKNKREAEATEHYWIEELAATLNTNKPYAKCKEEPKLYKHCWYEEKKDYVLTKAKDHYEEHKEDKLEYQKEYAEKNKEKIKEYQDDYREKNKEELAAAKKIYREAHKEEASQAHKEWRKAHEEELKAKRAQVIECECGSQYTFGNKDRHLQSKKHVDYQNQLSGIVETKEIFTEEELEQIKEQKTQHTKEKQKEYRIKNVEKIKEFKKKYNEEHKEKIKEQCKSYYEENKETILEKVKQYSDKNKEKTKDYKEDWYQKNKEKILAKQKEIYTCECGSEVRCSGRAEHNRSVKHEQFIEKNKIVSIQ